MTTHLEAFLCDSRFIRRLSAVMVATLILVIIGDILFVIVFPDSPRFFRIEFDVDVEGNLATWVNSVFDLLAGLSALLVGWLVWQGTSQKSRFVMVSWVLVAGIFIYLSMDDSSQFHDNLMVMLSGLAGKLGSESQLLEEQRGYIWIFVLGVPGFIIALAAFRFLYRQIWPVKRARWFLIAGFVLLLSNPLTEAAENTTYLRAGYSWPADTEKMVREDLPVYRQLATFALIQEVTEMLAVILFTLCFLYTAQAFVYRTEVETLNKRPTDRTSVQIT